LKVVILANGLGTDISDETKDMIEIGGKPIFGIWQKPCLLSEE